MMDLKVRASRMTTTSTARRISQTRLSRVDSLMSLLMRSSEMTPYSRTESPLSSSLVSMTRMVVA